MKKKYQKPAMSMYAIGPVSLMADSTFSSTNFRSEDEQIVVSNDDIDPSDALSRRSRQGGDW